MATFQDARDGLDALLQDKGARLKTPQRDSIIEDAGRAFSRRVPRIITKEIQGDGGFSYALPTDFIDGFSTIKKIISPFQTDFQDPEPLEPKDYRLQRSESLGLRLHFITTSPNQNDKFLFEFSSPHTVDSTGGGRIIGTLTTSGSIVSVDSESSSVDVEKASGARVFLRISSGSGSLLVFVQASEDNTNWADIASFNPITVAGDNVLRIEKSRVSKYMRLRYEVVSGTWTLGAVVETRGDGTLTVPDFQLDAFNYLSASLAAQALSGSFASTIDSTLQGDTSDFEGKSTFWSNISREWREKFNEEISKTIQKSDSAVASGQGEWDIHGTTRYRHLLHPARFR